MKVVSQLPHETRHSFIIYIYTTKNNDICGWSWLPAGFRLHSLEADVIALCDLPFLQDALMLPVHRYTCNCNLLSRILHLPAQLTIYCYHPIAHHEVHLPSLKNASRIMHKKRDQTILDHTRVASEEPHLPCPSTLRGRATNPSAHVSEH